MALDGVIRRFQKPENPQYWMACSCQTAH